MRTISDMALEGVGGANGGGGSGTKNGGSSGGGTGVLDNSSRLLILQAFTEKNLDNINNMLLDVQAQMIQMNQCWSETLARFFYELK